MALEALARIQNHSFYDQLYSAAANAYLGNQKDARHHLAQSQKENPRLTATSAGYYFPYRDRDDLDHVLVGLKIAGWAR